MAQTLLQEALTQLIQSELSNTTGNFSHSGDYNINGVLTVDTLNVTNLVTAGDKSAELGKWVYNTEAELAGKGFSWTHGLGAAQLIYRTGNRLWTNAIVDIPTTSSYSIDNIPVLSAGQLGSSITRSNLNTVGTLNSLNVAGDVEIGEFVFVNSTFNRVGLGTNEPNGSLSILDNNVEIILGSPSIDVGCIGTHSSHALQIITDNLPRITVSNSGDTTFAGNVTVNGTISALAVVTDNRVDRTHPLQFSATRDSSVYGLGLEWSGTGNIKQLVMMAGPDRIWSSEDVGLDNGKCFYIGSSPVLSASTLGAEVVNSSLTKLGVLSSLSVGGESNFAAPINAKSIVVDNGIELNRNGFNAGNQVALTVQSNEIIYGDASQISIGDSSLQTKPVKVFGKLSVGINNPDPSVNFSVNGDVKIGGKKITNGPAAPTSGGYLVGDICWNTNPQPNAYVGWVCISEGTPGQWAGFGLIANR